MEFLVTERAEMEVGHNAAGHIFAGRESISFVWFGKTTNPGGTLNYFISALQISINDRIHKPKREVQKEINRKVENT